MYSATAYFDRPSLKKIRKNGFDSLSDVREWTKSALAFDNCTHVVVSHNGVGIYRVHVGPDGVRRWEPVRHTIAIDDWTLCVTISGPMQYAEFHDAGGSVYQFRGQYPDELVPAYFPSLVRAIVTKGLDNI